MENPEDPGVDPFPSMFLTEEAERLRSRHQAFDIGFDQCMVGLAYRKPTQILTNIAPFKELFHGLRCCHGKHQPMSGVDADGNFVTKAQSRYPAQLCRLLAQGMSKLFPLVAEEAEDDREDEDEEAQRKWVLQRSPPIAECWDPLSRWRERFRVSWSRLEHNNIGELRIAILALKHMSRSRHFWEKRALLFTDSLVVLGVLTKGRSSSWPLLRLARQAAPIAAVLQVRPIWRHVETTRNHADGPSRGFA